VARTGQKRGLKYTGVEKWSAEGDQEGYSVPIGKRPPLGFKPDRRNTKRRATRYCSGKRKGKQRETRGLLNYDGQHD